MNKKQQNKQKHISARILRTAGRMEMGYNLKHPKIAESITDLIGRTPMLRLNKVTAGSKAEVSISIPVCLCV